MEKAKAFWYGSEVTTGRWVYIGRGNPFYEKMCGREIHVVEHSTTHERRCVDRQHLPAYDIDVRTEPSRN